MTTNSSARFLNPYAPSRGERVPNVKRITTEVSESDYNLIKCIRPGTATISGSLGLLWKKLTDQLRIRGITDVSQQNEFEHYIANSHIISDEEYTRLCVNSGGSGGLSNRTTGGAVQNSNAPHVIGTTTATGDAHTTASPESTDLQGGSGSRGKGKRGKGKKGENQNQP